MFPWIGGVFVACIGYAAYFFRSRAIAHELDLKVAAGMAATDRAREAEEAAFALTKTVVGEISDFIASKIARSRMSKGIRAMDPEVGSPMNGSPTMRVRFIDGKITKGPKKYASILTISVWAAPSEFPMTPTMSMTRGGSPLTLSTPLTADQKAAIWATASQVFADYLVKQKLKATV